MRKYLIILLLFAFAFTASAADMLQEEEDARTAAKQLEDQKQFPQAIRMYEKALKLSNQNKTKNRDIKINIAKLYAWTNQFDISAAKYRELVSEEPADLDTKALYAKVLLWGKRYSESVAVFSEILRVSPDNYDCLSGKSAALIQIGKQRETAKDFAGALEVYQEALEINTRLGVNNRDLRISIANIYKWTAQTNKAIPLYKELVRENPADMETKISYASVLAWNGNYEESLQVYEEILREDPDNKDAKMAKSVSLEKAGKQLEMERKYSEALEMYLRALEFSVKPKKDNRDLRVSIARMQAWTDQRDAAISNYRELVDEQPDDTETKLAYAKVLVWNKDYQDAMAVYDEILAKEPDNPDAVSGKAITYSYSGDGDNAKIWLQKAIALSPFDKNLKEHYNNVKYKFNTNIKLGYNPVTLRPVGSTMADFYMQYETKPDDRFTTRYRFDHIDYTNAAALSTNETMFTAEVDYKYNSKTNVYGMAAHTPGGGFYPQLAVQVGIDYEVHKAITARADLRMATYAGKSLSIFIPDVIYYIGMFALDLKDYHVMASDGTINDSVVFALHFDPNPANSVIVGVSKGTVSVLNQNIQVTSRSITGFFASLRFPLKDNLWLRLAYDNQDYTIFTRDGITAELIFNW